MQLLSFFAGVHANVLRDHPSKPWWVGDARGFNRVVISFRVGRQFAADCSDFFIRVFVLEGEAVWVPVLSLG